MDENSFLAQEETGVLLWDLTAFFDNISLSLLVGKALDLQFPQYDLYMALLVHAAPRVLRANGHVSGCIPVNGSILAGCAKAIPLTRVMLYRTLEIVHNTRPPAPLTLPLTSNA